MISWERASLGLGGLFTCDDGVFAGAQIARGPVDSGAALPERALAFVQVAFERGQLFAALAGVILRLVAQVLGLLAGRELRFLASGANLALGALEQSPGFFAGTAHCLGGDPPARDDPHAEEDQTYDSGREAGSDSGRQELHARLARSRRGMLGRNPRTPAITVWGGRMNLRVQVEPLCQTPPLGFLGPRRAHSEASRFTSIQQWLKRASMPSRVLQGISKIQHTCRAPFL